MEYSSVFQRLAQARILARFSIASKPKVGYFFLPAFVFPDSGLPGARVRYDWRRVIAVFKFGSFRVRLSGTVFCADTFSSCSYIKPGLMLRGRSVISTVTVTARTSSSLTEQVSKTARSCTYPFCTREHKSGGSLRIPLLYVSANRNRVRV